MRRISVLLGLAAILLTAVVAYTYRLRLERDSRHKVDPPPQIRQSDEAVADRGWTWGKEDPETNKPIARLKAKSLKATKDPSTFELHDLALRLYDKHGDTYTYVRSVSALFDERSEVMKSSGPVFIVMNVPSDKDAENKDQIENLVQVDTTAVTYETKSGKADTDAPASFKFADGGGQAVGVSYDPTTKELHLKSQVALDWVGDGPVENKMHIESGDLVYKEKEQKIYLSPWSRLQRQTTTIQAQNSLVTLQDGILHQVESDHAIGKDVREDKTTDYSADKMTALFDENGDLVNIVGEGSAKVVSTQASSRTTITGNRADLRFTVNSKEEEGETKTESDLHLVLADGHAVAQSDPLPQPGAQLAETRILRSEHIELEMKPSGKDVREIRAPSTAQLEFKPNRPDQSHRTLDASRLRILYGDGSYVDRFLARNAATHTDKPASLEKKGQPNPPALTWSDELTATFTPNTNQVATIEQPGHFRYKEGTRESTAKKAFLEQTINRITLTGDAHVSDDTGSAFADTIVMNQATGDMDATGHVISMHQPDKNEKPGTSMLDKTQSMQARADQMQTRENNTKVMYNGNVVMWQGANRISADMIDVDRDAQSLDACGNVVSELVDNNKSGSDGAANTSPPVFTIVDAPELSYRDDTRIAQYSGGVKLLRGKMTVTSQTLEAFLTPKTDSNKDQSSLNHAFAQGNVMISEVVAPGRTRTGQGEHAEYYTDQNKVVLNGGAPQMRDSYKGVTKGRQLTYFSDDDRLIVEGDKRERAYTRMRKR
jgi:lipopolysaccharide export system protein LptA